MPFLQSGIIIIFPTIRYHHSTHCNLFPFHGHVSNHHIKILMLASFQLPSSSPSFPGKSVSSPPRGFSPSCLDSQPASRKRHHDHYDQMYFDDHCVLSCCCFFMPMVASPLQMQGLYILTRGLGLENHVWFRSSCSTIFTTFTSQSLSRPLSIAINHHEHLPRCLNEARINPILHPRHPLHRRLDATPTW